MKDISEQMKDIMLRIKSRRESLDLSFQQLADLTGMSKSTLQRYETGGIKNIPLDKLEVLAKALQTSPEWILGWNRKMDDWDKAVYKFFPDFIPGKIIFLMLLPKTKKKTKQPHFRKQMCLCDLYMTAFRQGSE